MTATLFFFVALYLVLGVASLFAIMSQYKYRKHVYVSFGVMTGVLLVAALFMPKEKKPENDGIVRTQEAAPNIDYLKADAQASKPESKQEYIASTTKIGGKKAPIYYKELFKNPAKFLGQRVNILGKIMVIEEANGATAIQIQVSSNLDSVIVHYDGTVPVYQGDLITVYGEGAGSQDGSNRMGAAMTWPVIKAQYIVKRASSDD